MSLEQQKTLFPDLHPSPFDSASGLAPARLPTNSTTHRHPIHRWFNFIAGFSPEFVQLCLKSERIGNSDTLLDPFAGCATAPLAACQWGVKAVGFEPHPILARLARAKLPDESTVGRLKAIQAAIAAGLSAPMPLEILPDAPQQFLSKLFPAPALRSLLGAREAIKERGLSDDDLAFAILSKVLDKSSHSQTDGIYKAPTSRKTCSPPSEALKAVVEQIVADLRTTQGRSYARMARIYEADAANMHYVADGSVAIVVTSPPYLNNFDFAEMTRMLLYFWGVASSWGEITDKVRARLIVNTTTALKGHRDNQSSYRLNIPASLHPALDAVVTELGEQRGQRAGKKEYDLLVYPYFSQVTDVFRECFRCMKSGAAVHVMIADAALYGVQISAPQFLGDILSSIGFAGASCNQVRRRGHRWILDKRDGSRSGLGEYHVQARRP